MTSEERPRPSPLANRIAPWGDEIATAARGAFIGNRGVIHKGHRIVRRASTRGWVCCALSFRNRPPRKLMSPGRWTELFFLDEATAFAAGHRPCFECRREAALRFAEAWSAGQGLDARASAPAMDEVLNRERVHVGWRRSWERRRGLAALPDVAPEDLVAGAIVARIDEDNVDAFLYTGANFLRWTVSGYETGAPPDGAVRLLTPPSVVAAFRAGYAPQIDPSAGLA